MTGGRQSRCLAATTAVLALAALAVTGSALAKPEKVIVVNVEAKFGGDPFISAQFGTLDGSHPPALRRFKVRGDSNVEIDVTDRPDTQSVPSCNSGRRPRRTTAEMRKACRPAIVGTGAFEVEVQFPEQEPIELRSGLLALNGGVEGGVTKLYIHASFPTPVAAEIVTTMEVKKVHKGRFGTEMIASIPKIAGGSGSVTRFELNFKRGVLRASCPDGHLDTHYTAVFSDRTRTSARVTKPCGPKT